MVRRWLLIAVNTSWAVMFNLPYVDYWYFWIAMLWSFPSLHIAARRNTTAGNAPLLSCLLACPPSPPACWGALARVLFLSIIIVYFYLVLFFFLFYCIQSGKGRARRGDEQLLRIWGHKRVLGILTLLNVHIIVIRSNKIVRSFGHTLMLPRTTGSRGG